MRCTACFSDVKLSLFQRYECASRFRRVSFTVNEMWAEWPRCQALCRHYLTGEAMPPELLNKVIAASTFNQGHATTEYLAAALLDQRWHQVTSEQVPDADGVTGFETEALRAEGMEFAPVPPRYKTPYFSHILGGYSAGYYAYIWSEVLDANSVEWFSKNGGLTRENGDRFREIVLAKGGSDDPMTLFRRFAGAEPAIAPLLQKRGLTTA